MKKIAIILLIALIPATLFAGSVFDFALGLDAKYRPLGTTVLESVNKGTYEFKVTDIIPGFAAEAKAFIFDVNGTMDLKEFVSSDEAGNVKSSGSFGAGISANILLVRLTLGANYSYELNLTYDSSNTADPGLKFMKYDPKTGVYTPVDNIKEATFDLRAAADVMIGKLSVGAYVLFPTEFSINNQEFVRALKNYNMYIAGANGGVRLMWHFL